MNPTELYDKLLLIPKAQFDKRFSNFNQLTIILTLYTGLPSPRHPTHQSSIFPFLIEDSSILGKNIRSRMPQLKRDQMKSRTEAHTLHGGLCSSKLLKLCYDHIPMSKLTLSSQKSTINADLHVISHFFSF